METAQKETKDRERHPLQKYFRKERFPTMFCPGCGNGIVMSAVMRAVDNLTEFSIDNTVPNTTVPTIDPATAYTTDGLSCNATLTDPEDNPLTAYWTWYKNDLVNTSGSIVVSNGTNSNITSMSSSNTLKGEQWICKVTPGDATQNGTSENSTTRTIQNSIPVIGNPTLNETAPFTNDILECLNGS